MTSSVLAGRAALKASNERDLLGLVSTCCNDKGSLDKALNGASKNKTRRKEN